MISAVASSAVLRVGRLAGWLSSSHSAAVAFLIAFSLVCFLPGYFTLPPIDRDESRFAQASKQMLETADFTDIRFQEVARYKKPVGIYWLQAGAVKVAEAAGIPEARTSIAIYRLPSLIGAIGVVLATYWSALAFLSRRYALLAGALICSSLLLGVEARLAKTDAMLTLASVLAMGALVRAYLTSRSVGTTGWREAWTNAAVFWTAVALGILLKGPLVPFFVLLAVGGLLIADRTAKWTLGLKPVTGTVFTLLVVLPWFVSVMFRSDGAFIQESMGQDLIGKLFSGQESHGAPPGFYWVLFWVTFWPAAPLAVLATGFAWQRRSEPGVRFLLAWIVPAWIILELVVTKLPHYVLPLYPAFAILVALALQNRTAPQGTSKYSLLLWPVIAILICGAVMFAGFRYGQGVSTLAIASFVAAIAISIAAVHWAFRRSLELGICGTLVSAALVYQGGYFTLPSSERLLLSPRIVESAKFAPCGFPQIASAGFHEPSLVFLGGTNVRFLKSEEAAKFLSEPGCRAAAVSKPLLPKFEQEAARLELTLKELGKVSGVNYSNGREVELTIFSATRGRP